MSVSVAGHVESTGKQSAKERSIVWGVVGWVFASLLVTAGLFIVIAYMHGSWVWPDASTDPDWIRTVVLSTLPTAGVLAGAAAIAITVRRQKTAEANLRIALDQFEHVRAEAAAATDRANQLVEREQVAGLRERFVTAAKQLGDVAEPIQLAGVYSLVALSDDWIARKSHSEAQMCIRLLCAFLKSSNEPAIRLAIFEVISQKLEGPEPAWSGYAFDLSGIRLGESDRVRLRGVTLGPGTDISFDHALMAGGQLDFANATIDGGRLDFTGADLQKGKIQFGGARFVSGDVIFKWVRFGKSIRVGLRPRLLRRGVVSFVNARGSIPVLVVPPSEAVIAARKSRKANANNTQ